MQGQVAILCFKQVCLDPILIYISLWIDCLFEIRKIAVCFLMNVFIALKGSHFWFLFDFTAAGVVPCGGRKTSPRTSTIVHILFWSFEISGNILRNKWLVKTHILDRFLFIWTPFWFISVFESTAYLKFAKLQYVVSGFRCRMITGSLMRLY